MSSKTRWLRAIIPIALLLCSVLLFATPTSARAATDDTLTGPTAPTWYFAEGRVGGGFRQWLTIGNPNASDCTVNIQYNYTLDRGGSDIKKVTVKVNRMSRLTQYVNNDLGIAQYDIDAATLSAIVSTSDCTGITAERPMYFNQFHGASSGTDVFGATTPDTVWYFADVPRSSAGESFLAVLNPNNTDATVKVSYFVGGATPIAETKTVAANSRNTFFPNDLVTAQRHVAVKVESTNGVKIVVERPTYYIGVNGVSGAADVMGVLDPQAQWVFAAGTTAESNHEDIAIANPHDTSIDVTVELLSASGSTRIVKLSPIAANSQFLYDVSADNVFDGHTDDVAAIVTGSDTLLAQRIVYSNYSGSNKNSSEWTAQGVSASSGVANVNGKPDIETPHNSNFVLPQSYSFAEGFTSVDFNEWIMLTNPTATNESISIQFVNMLGESDTATVPVPAHSRYSFNATSFVENSHTFNLANVKAYAVSATVTGNGPFVAERVMYWNAFDTEGTSAVSGYAPVATAPVEGTPSITVTP